jgi:hypothetical protein
MQRVKNRVPPSALSRGLNQVFPEVDVLRLFYQAGGPAVLAAQISAARAAALKIAASIGKKAGSASLSLTGALRGLTPPLLIIIGPVLQEQMNQLKKRKTGSHPEVI